MEPKPIDPLPEGEGADGADRRTAKERADDMLVVLYEEMRRIAGGHMRRQPENHTLQATALVNEAYLRIQSRQAKGGALDHDRLLALAARAMRSVLVDNARAKNRIKRRAPGLSVPLDEVTSSYEEHAIDLLALDDALERLGQVDETMVRVVELRFFGGLPAAEVARTLGISVHRAEKEWQTARAWLREELE